MIEKAELRKYYRDIRRRITNDDRQKKSDAVRKILFDTKEYRNAKTVFVYVSLDDEVCTDEIIKGAISDKKTVCVPYVNKQDKTMKAVKIESLNDLKIGAYNIREPESDENEVDISDISLSIVPGLAFDKKGNRLGFGGGFYDRFLAKFSGVSIGLSYSDCVANELPTDIYDMAVGMVITENKVI